MFNSVVLNNRVLVLMLLVEYCPPQRQELSCVAASAGFSALQAQSQTPHISWPKSPEALL